MSEYGLLPTVVTYTSLIDGICQHSGTEHEFKVLQEMEKNNCQPSLHTYTALIHGLCKEGKVDYAEELFEEMQKKGIKPDVATFTSLIDGFIVIGLKKECYLLVNKVVVKNDISYCFPSDAEDIRAEVVSNLLVRLSEIDNEPTISTYSTLITGLCREGKCYEAEQLFKNMQDKELPLSNDIYNSLLIIHCKNLRVDRALDFLKSVSSSGLEPTLATYGFLISMLSKMNQMDEAILPFKNVLAEKWNSDEVVWSVLIDGLLKEGLAGPCLKLLHILSL